MKMASIANFADEVAWADVIYLRGGDTPTLVKALQADLSWTKHLAGKTVVGTSAGACALAQYDYDVDHFKLSDNLGLLPIKVLPHYRSDYGAPHVNWDSIEQTLSNYKEPLELVLLREGEYRVFEQIY
jgi:peptidase E